MIACEGQRHQAHNHHRIVGVDFATHNAGGDQQAADNRRFTLSGQLKTTAAQQIRDPAREQDANKHAARRRAWS